MPNSELLVCPFCGGPAELEEVDGGGWSVGCEEKPLSVHYCMGYQSLTSFATKREAISAWNTRTQLDELRAERRMLLDLLAIIHRDGGQYVDTHGLEKAWQDAITLTAELRAENERLKNACGRQRVKG